MKGCCLILFSEYGTTVICYFHKLVVRIVGLINVLTERGPVMSAEYKICAHSTCVFVSFLILVGGVEFVIVIFDLFIFSSKSKEYHFLMIKWHILQTSRDLHSQLDKNVRFFIFLCGKF